MSDPAQTTTSPQDNAQATAAQAVVKSLASAPPVQPEPQVSARAKELAPPSEVTVQEVATGAQAIEQEPIPPEVEAWMEKVGESSPAAGITNLPKVELPTAPAPAVTASSTAFVLPLGREELESGSKASVNDSIRWLSEWCKRIIKQLKGQAVYKAT